MYTLTGGTFTISSALVCTFRLSSSLFNLFLCSHACIYLYTFVFKLYAFAYIYIYIHVHLILLVVIVYVYLKFYLCHGCLFTLICRFVQCTSVYDYIISMCDSAHVSVYIHVYA